MPRLHLGSSTDHRRRSTSSIGVGGRLLSTTSASSSSSSNNNSSDGNGAAEEVLASRTTYSSSSLVVETDETGPRSGLGTGRCDDVNGDDVDDGEGGDTMHDAPPGVFDYNSSSSGSEDDDENDELDESSANDDENYKRSNNHHHHHGHRGGKRHDVQFQSSTSTKTTKAAMITTTTSSSSKEKPRRGKLANTATTTTTIGGSSNNDERWMDNFNLLRKCLNTNDGSIDYNLIETRDENDCNDCRTNDDCDDINGDDDDDVQVMKKRLRNFVKEQRRQCSIRCNNSGSSSRSGGGRNSNSSERIRLLTEVGFNFRPSETTTKAHAQEKRLTTKATTKKTVVSNSHGGGGSNDDTWMNDIDDDCLVDTDDEDEGGGVVSMKQHHVKKSPALKSNNGKGDKLQTTVTKKKTKTTGESKNVTKKSGTATKKKSVISLKKGNIKDDDDDGSSSSRYSVVGENNKGRRKHVPVQLKQNANEVVVPQRVLAIDNRILPSPTHDVMARSSFLKYIPQLIYGGLERGVLSSVGTTGGSETSNSTIIASFEYDAKTSSRRDDMGVSVVRPRVAYLFEQQKQKQQQRDDTAQQQPCMHDGENELSMTTTWLADILQPVNVGGRCNNNMLHVADGVDDIEMDDNRVLHRGIIPHNVFAAVDSWRYLGDLVIAVVESKKLSKLTSTIASRTIELLTTDSNLFADVTSASHILGLESFWKRICSVFDKRNLASTTITIIIVETISAIERLNTIKKYHTSSVSPFDNETTTPAVQHPSRLDVMQCVSDIRRRITELSRRDASQYNIQLDLEFIEGNSISFQSLLQTWVKDSFDQVYSSTSAVGSGSSGGVRGRLTFDLPETLDGIMCSISLDLQYTVLPNCITSHATQGLVDEMRLLSKLSSSSVEVVQTVALSSVDSSLLYGIPMSARSSLDNDIHRCSEMKMLTRQLWTYLSKNDAALVLRVRPGGLTNVYHHVEEQLFLLVCEEVLQTQPQALDHELNDLDPEAFEIVPDNNCLRRGKSPCSGVLYRYATKNQMLRFGNEDTRYDMVDGEETDMSEHYIDIVERSLDTLIKTGLNPLLMDRNMHG